VSRTIVAVDIGGTHARFALAEVDGGRVVSLGEPITMQTRDHASFQLAWQDFRERNPGDEPDAIGIAFAGPVTGDVLKLTNNPWVIRPALIKEKLGVRDFVIVNDFGAVAHAVAHLGDEHLRHVCGPDGPMPDEGVTSIVGPGTGLGVAQLLRRDGAYHVIETEGGHVDFAPLDSIDDQILEFLRRSLRRVSIERVACGSGLVNIYQALAHLEGKAIASIEDKALWAAALDGSDPIAAAALDRFFLILGAATGDLALAHGANAVVLAGGLGYRLRDRFAGSGFSGRFIAKGRFERRMESIPVRLITHPQPGLFGAAAAFAKEYP
jgi:glucokinase